MTNTALDRYTALTEVRENILKSVSSRLSSHLTAPVEIRAKKKHPTLFKVKTPYGNFVTDSPFIQFILDSDPSDAEATVKHLCNMELPAGIIGVDVSGVFDV